MAMNMQILNKPSLSWLIIPALVVLAGCSSDSDFDFDASQEAADTQAAENSAPEALFSPSGGIIPFPSNLLRNTSTDGLLAIPIAEDMNDPSNPQVALNQLDGFSTTSPITTAVSEALDPTSLKIGETIRIFEITAAAPTGPLSNVVSGFVEEINPATMVAREVDKQLVLIPTVPLKPSTSYLVALTTGILDTQGNAMQAGLTYRLLKGDQVLTDDAAEGLRGITGSHIGLLGGQLNVDPDTVVLSWVFTTQSTRDVLQAVKDISPDNTTLSLLPTGKKTSDVVPASPGIADIYVGSLELPYYLTALSDTAGPQDVLNSFWKNDAGFLGAIGADGSRNYTPAKTTDVKVPVLMTVPNIGDMPTSGWPVTIFLHGITRDRSNMLAIADAMATVGRAVIAIDIPLHGITDKDSDLHASKNPNAPTERTFEMDLLTVDATTGLSTPGPDGTPDSSGTHFLNLTDLANARDNNRQAIADLFELTDSLSSVVIEGTLLDAGNLNFVGHSLGGILGTTMLSYENRFQTATLAMPGGGIAQTLANSERFAPPINAALAARGVLPGTSEYQQFFLAAQSMLDSADPINHASTLAASGSTRIHLIKLLGDLTVPNSVATAPLSGTDPLIRMLGLPPVAETVMDSNAAVTFNSGHHGSILGPLPQAEDSTQAPDLAPTLEMQSQMSGFAESGGAELVISNTEIIQPLQTSGSN